MFLVALFIHMQKRGPSNWHLNVLSIFCGGVFPMCWISIAKPLQACFVKSHHYVMHSRRPIYLTKSNKTFLHTLFCSFCRWFAILFPESWMHTSFGKKWLPCVIGSKLQKKCCRISMGLVDSAQRRNDLIHFVRNKMFEQNMRSLHMEIDIS